MIDEQDIVIEELQLHDYNFPRDYVNMVHPEDYKEVSQFEPHFRIYDWLIARIAWKTNENTMIPMTFICNTGAPSHFYLSRKALGILEGKKLLCKDDLGLYVNIHIDNVNTFKASVKQVPDMYKNANFIGLKALSKLQMHLTADGFCFNDKFVYM